MVVSISFLILSNLSLILDNCGNINESFDAFLLIGTADMQLGHLNKKLTLLNIDLA